MSDENKTTTQAAPAPTSGPSAAARGAAENMKRGRGRPPGSKNKSAPSPASSPADPPKEPSAEEKPKDPPPIPWDDARTEKALEQIGVIGEKLGVPEWKVSADERKFVAPYLTPFMGKIVPDPQRANVLLTVLIFLGIFGNAIIATIERIQIVSYRVAMFVMALRDRVMRMFKRQPPEPPKAGDDEPQPARRQESEGVVLKPIERPS